MDDCQKTIDALVKAFDEFAVKVKEMADALAEAFGFGPSVSENKRKKSLSSPGSIWDVFAEISKGLLR